MKVAYVCADPGVPVFGRKGASVHVREMVRAFCARGAKVTLLARRIGGEPPPGLEGVRVLQLPGVTAEGDAERERQLLAVDPQAARLLEGCGGLDLVYERHSLWSHSAMEYASQRGIPSFLEVNAPLLAEQAAYRSLAHPELAREAAVRAIAAAGSVGAVSQGVARYVRELVPWQENIHVLPNGVDTHRVHPLISPLAPAPSGVVTVGFVGTLKPWHGLEVLVEAFAIASRRAPLRLLIVGDGPQRSTIEGMAEQLGVSGATEFAGAVDPEDVPGWLTSMDIATAPYPPLDGFYFSPLKLYEYMAAGRAIVASRIGQIEDVIEHGVTGVLVPAGDPSALAEAISGLAGQPTGRVRLGAAARERACARHTWGAVARRTLRIAGVEPAGAGS